MSKRSTPFPTSGESNELERLQARLLAAFPQRQGRSAIEDVFSDLQLFRHLLEEQKGDRQLASNALLQQAIDILREVHAEHANVLQAYFLSDEKIDLVANQLHISVPNFHHKRTIALPWLAEKIAQLELDFRAAHRQHMLQRLPVQTYLELVGQQVEVSDLCNLLCAPTAPWLVSINGIGGIGKTTLANVIARQMIDSPVWAGIGWVRAPQSIPNAGGAIQPQTTPTLAASVFLDVLTAQLLDEPSQNGRRSTSETLALLESLLKQQAYLIVLDNLESEVDLQELLPTLRRLANPTKFLITSRSILFEAGDLYQWIVPELDEVNARALLRAEARIRNIPEVLAASDADLHPIYSTVGGNPLALKLVGGQLRIYSLATVLEDLSKARGQRIEELYAHIYRRAWAPLGDTTKGVLLAMPLVSEEGGTIELLRAMCEIADDDLVKALEILISLSLVEVRGDLQNRRYTIHSLTRTFLHEQVLRWQ